MDDALARTEYPSMLGSLTPAQAVSVFADRHKRIHTMDNEVADWLEERRRIEEVYVQNLTKLARKQPPGSSSELGIFTSPWTKIVGSVETIAQSHNTFASRLEKDIIQALRQFPTKNKEMSQMPTIQGNLESMAKEVESSQKSSEKLFKKGGKANSAKVDAAIQKSGTARQEWDTQAPFVFEKLQAVDESRLNHLRDVLTQYLTHESDQIERCRIGAEGALNSMLEVDTATEIRNFASNSTRGKPKVERPSTARAQSSSGGAAFVPPVGPARSSTDDQASVTSGRNNGDNEKENKGLKSRFGTMLNRRRQSVHGSSGFARAPSPTKSPFGRAPASRDGRPSPSPRASSGNLRGSTSGDNRLSSLAEVPAASDTPLSPTNGVSGHQQNGSEVSGVSVGGASRALPDLSDVQPPPGPPPSHVKSSTDSEGFSVPATRDDPISLAQYEASQGEANEQQQFKLDIKNEPIREEGDDAQAALANVANTLRVNTLTTPNRKAGTVRGRRDVRNTMYIPAVPVPTDFRTSDFTPISPVGPGLSSPIGTSRTSAVTALSTAEPSASDAGSIRSSRSLGNTAGLKHPDMLAPGLNSSIIETVSATFENGEIKSASVIGELALAHGYDSSKPMASSGTETIRLNNFQALEAIAPNHAFVNELSADKPGEYALDLSHIAKSAVAFRYKVHIDESNLASYAPIIVKPAWKPQDDKLGVVIEYGLNPAFGSTPITLHNFVLLATYDGGKAAGCQTKPTGTHLKEKTLIYWRIGDVTVDTTFQKVIGRLIGSEGAQLKGGIVEARWEHQSQAGSSVGSGLGLSRLDPSKGAAEADPFADDSVPAASSSSQWVEVGTLRKIVSGKYDARQVIREE